MFDSQLDDNSPVQCCHAAFALDVRSLALFRVALGVVFLADLAIRASDFSAMYAEGGMAPVELVRSELAAGEWSLHLLSGATAVQAGLMAAAAGLAGALILGFHTRVATIGSWLLAASLDVRLPIVLNAGDTLLRVLLFWGMFLPLGAAWSVDGRRSGPLRSTVVRSPATAAFLVQLALVYWCAGLSKLNPAWLHENALGQIFSYALYGRPLGEWLGQFPDVTRWMGWAVVALELLGPWLLFAPWRNAQCRLVAAAMFAAFHVGIAATITVGMFPWVGLAGWLAVLPRVVWGKRAKPQAAGSSPVARPGEGGGLIAACIFALLTLVVAWNAIDLLGRDFAPRLYAALRPVANATMLRQSWKVFSEPERYDAWFVYEGRLTNGERVDLLRGTPLADDERTAAGQTFANHRWRKLHARLPAARWAEYRQPLADYVCRAWNETHRADDQAVRLDAYAIRRPVAFRGEPDGFVRMQLAQVLVDREEGNFADALRELEE